MSEDLVRPLPNLRLRRDKGPIRKVMKQWLLVVFFGMVLGLAFSSILNRWLTGHWPAMDWQWIVFASLIGIAYSTSYYVFIGLPMSWARPHLRETTSLMNWSTTILLGILGASLGFIVPTFLISKLTHGALRLPENISLILLFDLVLATILTLLILGYVRLRNEIRGAEGTRHAHELQLRDLATAAARARCSVLQSQINPHFFFNTLTTLSSLIKSDPIAASTLVDNLARLFRYSLGCSADQLQSIDAEFDFVRAYLDIEKVRFGDRIRVEWDISLNGKKYALPGLTVQPLVENAVTHGVLPFPEGGTIRIGASANHQGFSIRVVNWVGPRFKFEEKQWFQPGHSLSIIQERLQLEYADQATLRFELKDGWLIATVDIPTLEVESCAL